MTKGQNVAVDVIEAFVADENAETLSWDKIMNSVKESGAKVKNWLTIRGVLQYFMDENIIKRTENLSVEEYAKV